MTENHEKGRNQALNVLEVLEAKSREEKGKSPRLLSCLSDFPCGYTEGWFMVLPACFRQALDIRKDERVVQGEEGRIKTLVWTQDFHFDFHRGDTIFDHVSAITASTWEDALLHVRWVFQVAQDPSFFPGHVVADIFILSEGKKALLPLGRETWPAFDFVRCLVQGPSPELMEKWRFQGGLRPD